MKGSAHVEPAGDGLLRPVDARDSFECLEGPQERLARHALPVGALASQQLGLDQDRAQTAPCAVVGDILPGRPAAQDHDVADLRAHAPAPDAAGV